MKKSEQGGFLGSMQDFTVYRRKDVKQDILKTKGGPTREQIFSKPSFANTRLNISEFGGRSKLASRVNTMLASIKPVMGHNINNAVNSLSRPIQELDTSSPRGKRHVQLSQKPALLEGLQLNPRNPLEAVISNTIAVDADRNGLSALITMPDLLPGINFHGIGTFPFYRVVAVLGLVPDIFYNANGYAPDGDYDTVFPALHFGDWQQVHNYTPANTISLSLPYSLPTANCSLVVTVGISFGLMRKGMIEAENGAGAGKLMKVV